MRLEAKCIWKTFLHENAPQRVSICATTLARIKSNLRQRRLRYSLFQEGMLEMSNMLMEHFTHFRQQYSADIPVTE